MKTLSIGDPAPPFSLQSSEGRELSLQEFRGKRVILYFYPKDDTPGCTKEACQFRDTYPDFTGADAVVLGVSPDALSAHDKFRSKYSLPFPLLSDPDHAVAEAYGAWGEKKSMYGRTSIGIIRSTFLIDADGVIARAWYNVRADGHANKVLAELRG